MCCVVVMRSSDLLVTDPRPLMSLRAQIFDHDAGNEMLIDDVEFSSAMRDKFGYKGPSHALSQLFAFLDTDHGGAIGFDELVSDQRFIFCSESSASLRSCTSAHARRLAPMLFLPVARPQFEFIRGRRCSLDARNKRITLRLEPPPGAVYTLRDILWNVDSLRFLLQQSLKRGNVKVTDLMKAWDSSQDGQLSRREFLLKIQTFFKEDDAQLWETDVKSVALDAFNEMDDGGDVQDRGSVDLQEMERWLRVPTGPKVIRLKRRKRLSPSPQGQSGHEVGAPRRSPLIRETVQGSIAAAVERAAQARLAEQERAQRWRVPRDTPVNGLPPLQRWEVSAASELPPLMTGGGGKRERPDIEVSPRFGPAVPRSSPERPPTHRMPLLRAGGLEPSVRHALNTARGPVPFRGPLTFRSPAPRPRPGF